MKPARSPIPLVPSLKETREGTSGMLGPFRLFPPIPSAAGNNRGTTGNGREPPTRIDYPDSLLSLVNQRYSARSLAGNRRTDDDRVTCTACGHYRPHRCGNHTAAGLQSPDIACDLAVLPQQHCPGWRAKP